MTVQFISSERSESKNLPLSPSGHIRMRSQPRLCVRDGEIPGHQASGPGSCIPRLRSGQARSGRFAPYVLRLRSG
jgi:hypothetical protein